MLVNVRQAERADLRSVELARPRLVGALLDAGSHGLRTLPDVQIDRLPRMADFALWATAWESALWPAGGFARSYAANRRAAARMRSTPTAWMRAFMGKRGAWTGSATDLLRAEVELAADGFSRPAPAGPTTRGRSPAAYGALKQPCARSALRSRSVGKGRQEGAPFG
jgi:hypothetical protein